MFLTIIETPGVLSRDNRWTRSHTTLLKERFDCNLNSTLFSMKLFLIYIYFRHILHGSTQVGRIVNEAAAKNI